MGRPPDADPVVGRRPVPSIAATATTATANAAATTDWFVVPAGQLLGRRRRQVLVPFQYGLRSPVLFRRTVYRFGRYRRRGLTPFPWKKRKKTGTPLPL